MMQVLPVLMQAYKGVVPSQIYDHYQQEGGWERLEFDLLIATEMQDQMADIYGSASSPSKAKAIGERRKQRANRRRAAAKPLTDDEAVAALEDFGINMGGD